MLIPEDERYQQTTSRKIREAMLAYQITQKLSKSQILEMYLNEIFYGNQAYGIEAAVGDLLRQARPRADAGRSVDAGGPAAVAVGLRPAPATRSLPRSARRTCSTRWSATASSPRPRTPTPAEQAELRYQPAEAAVPGAALGRCTSAT